MTPILTCAAPYHLCRMARAGAGMHRDGRRSCVGTSDPVQSSWMNPAKPHAGQAIKLDEPRQTPCGAMRGPTRFARGTLYAALLGQVDEGSAKRSCFIPRHFVYSTGDIIRGCVVLLLF